MVNRYLSTAHTSTAKHPDIMRAHSHQVEDNRRGVLRCQSNSWQLRSSVYSYQLHSCLAEELPECASRRNHALLITGGGHQGHCHIVISGLPAQVDVRHSLETRRLRLRAMSSAGLQQRLWVVESGRKHGPASSPSSLPRIVMGNDTGRDGSREELQEHPHTVLGLA